MLHLYLERCLLIDFRGWLLYRGGDWDRNVHRYTLLYYTILYYILYYTRLLRYCTAYLLATQFLYRTAQFSSVQLITILKKNQYCHKESKKSVSFQTEFINFFYDVCGKFLLKFYYFGEIINFFSVSQIIHFKNLELTLLLSLETGNNIILLYIIDRRISK